jgi:hypothetical protein
MMLPMSSPKTVVLIGALSLAGGWLIGTTTAPMQEPAAVGASRPRPLGVPPGKGGVYTEQLRQKLRDQPRSPMPGRNPFVFGSRGSTMSVRPRRAEPTPAAEPAAFLEIAPAPVAPRFKLSGVASSEKDGATTLTAIIVDNGTMVFVKAGDTLSGGHRVVRVDEKGVVIADAAGVEQTLRLP